MGEKFLKSEETATIVNSLIRIFFRTAYDHFLQFTMNAFWLLLSTRNPVSAACTIRA